MKKGDSHHEFVIDISVDLSVALHIPLPTFHIMQA